MGSESTEAVGGSAGAADRLRVLLGPAKRSEGENPFERFAEETRTHGAPRVVWNLGGAADTSMLLTRVLPDAQRVWCDVPVRPVIYIVSDRDQRVFAGLCAALVGGDVPTPYEFGHFANEWRFSRSGWAQFSFLPPQEAEGLAATRTYPSGTRIANATIHATVATSEMLEDARVIVVYLHVDHEVAWSRILSPASCRVDALMSTRRGTNFEELMPSAGDRAALWRLIVQGKPDLRPQLWCCDSEVFIPPTSWDVLRRGGSYGDPGIAVPPWARDMQRTTSRGSLD